MIESVLIKQKSDFVTMLKQAIRVKVHSVRRLFTAWRYLCNRPKALQEAFCYCPAKLIFIRVHPRDFQKL